jgi:hypothetical protein
MTGYRLIDGLDGVQRTSDGAFIPSAAGNRDWQAYQAWLAEGNTPDPLPGPTPDDLLRAKLAAGIEITSSGSASLNGTYAIDDGAQSQITGLIALIGAGSGLPLGASKMPWPDQQGAPHEFTATDFKNFAAAVRDYVFGLRQAWGALKGDQQSQWPALPVAID